MFGIAYMKAPPTSYVLHYKGGRVKREGAGLSFFYYAPTSTLVVVPVGSTDLPFVFNETSADFQPATIQGQLTYRITDARRIAEVLDFSVKGTGQYASEDPQKLRDRLVHTTQIATRVAIHGKTLRELLTGADAIVARVIRELRDSEAVVMLGVEILGLAILSVRPSPEMSKALEADSREALLRSADEAIYARRNSAVEQERIIRENELKTEIAVEEKKRQIRETQIAADIAIEEQRTALLGRRLENERKEADTRAYALDTTLKPVRELDWRTLMALSAGGSDPKLMIGMAFRELAENATKIGELNITPDLLNSLITPAVRK